MPDITELAVATLVQAQRRVEVASQNLANATTPAYKRKVPFAALLGGRFSDTAVPSTSVAIDRTPGKVRETGSPFDLAILGEGYFAFRKGSDVTYSRSAALALTPDGRIANEAGFALQLSNGRDLEVGSASFVVDRDGTVKVKNEVVGQIAVYQFDSSPEAGGQSTLEGSTREPRLSPRSIVQQGAIEASNVVSGNEMVAIMEALRRAEAGQRVMTMYDDLLGKAISGLGSAAR